jgi:hypothetical protein
MSEKEPKPPASKAATPAAKATLERRVAEAIIGGALLRILQAVIGLVDFLELRLGLLVARIAIRVVLHGQLAEGDLEFDLGHFAADLEHLVKVTLGHRGRPNRSA